MIVLVMLNNTKIIKEAHLSDINDYVVDVNCVSDTDGTVMIVIVNDDQKYKFVVDLDECHWYELHKNKFCITQVSFNFLVQVDLVVNKQLLVRSVKILLMA